MRHYSSAYANWMQKTSQQTSKDIANQLIRHVTLLSHVSEHGIVKCGGFRSKRKRRHMFKEQKYQ